MRLEQLSRPAAQNERMKHILLFAGLLLVLLPGYALWHVQNIFLGLICTALVSGGFAFLAGSAVLFTLRRTP